MLKRCEKRGLGHFGRACPLGGRHPYGWGGSETVTTVGADWAAKVGTREPPGMTTTSGGGGKDGGDITDGIVGEEDGAGRRWYGYDTSLGNPNGYSYGSLNEPPIIFS